MIQTLELKSKALCKLTYTQYSRTVSQKFYKRLMEYQSLKKNVEVNKFWQFLITF